MKMRPADVGRSAYSSFPRDAKEAELVHRWLHGEDEVEFPLLALVHRALLAHARKHHSSFVDPEDQAQEAFLRLYAQLPEIRQGLKGSSLVAFALGIARRLNLETARRRRHWVPVDPQAEDVVNEPVAGLSVVVQVALKEQIDALECALHHLPSEQSAAIWCTKCLGMTASEAAAELGCEEATVRSRVGRGLKKLAQLFPDDEEPIGNVLERIRETPDEEEEPPESTVRLRTRSGGR